MALLVFTQLVPGMYVLKLKAQSLVDNAWGERLFNITVHEATHVNSPPVPIILPSINSLVLCVCLGVRLCVVGGCVVVC